MAAWIYTVHLTQWFHNEDMSFTEKRDAVADKIEFGQWRKLSNEPEYLLALVAELRKTKDTESFDKVFSKIYDLADDDRIWIETL